MALINCPECGREISDQAANCPGCGVSIAGISDVKGSGVQLNTIQETSKKLKLQTALSATLMIIGTIGTFLSTGAGEPTILVPFFLMTVVGLFWLITTKIRIWWHHK